MSITKYPDADFTPDIPNSGANTGKQNYNPTGSFRFWAQKVLPTVYDDSLSYYEILTKVVNYLNAVIQNVDSLNESVDNTNSAFDTLQEYVNDTKDTIVSAYNELQGYVNTYFDSLDVQEEINAKLDSMASDGSLSSVVSPFIPSVVTDWLSHNITPTSPAIDASLSVSKAGADAKVTGDKLSKLNERIDYEGYVLANGNTINLTPPVIGDFVSKGITYKVNDDNTITVTGTATDASFYNLFYNETGFPSGVVAGGEYYLSFSGTNVQGRVAVFEAEGIRDIVESNESVFFKIPLSATGLAVRVFVTNGTTVNETVNLQLFTAYTNKGLNNKINELKDAVLTKVTNIWHKGSISGLGEINADYRAIYSDIIPSCNYINVNYDYVAAVFLYKGDFYFGKVSANGTINKQSGDWKYFTGLIDISSILRVHNCDSARFCVLPKNTETVTEEKANDIGNTNCVIMCDKYVRNYNEFLDVLSDGQMLPTILGDPLYEFYKKFRFCLVDNSGASVTYGGSTIIRCTAICHFDKPIYVSVNKNDYQIGIYWNDSDGKHSKLWGETWEVPANVDVAICIRRAEWVSGAESLVGEEPWKYLFVRTLNDTPKDYFKDEIEATIQKIKEVNTEPSLCFTLSTDHHYMTTLNWLSKYDSISDMYANMKEISKTIKFDFNVSLGDVADFKIPYSDAVAKRFGISDMTAQGLDNLFYHWMEYATQRLYAINENFIYTPGNHDDNRYLRINGGYSGYDYTPGEMYSYYLSNGHKTSVHANPNNTLEYYFDMDNLNIRIILLDSNYYSNIEWDYGFSNSTASWLESVLNNSTGKQVLFMSHMSPIYSHNGDNYQYPNFAEVADVITAFKNNGGDIIAFLYGHSHCDWTTNTPWRDITFCCQKCHKLPTLFSNMPGSVAPDRTYGTATEDCWNVVIIKPISRKINIIRFGAGDDMEFDY